LIAISPHRLLRSVPESENHSGTEMLRNIRKIGMSSACGGSRFAAVNIPSRARLNR
jgi:hypothetical protein